MPRNDLGHARSLQKLLRTLLASTALGGLGVSVFVACGGAVDEGEAGRDAGGGVDPASVPRAGRQDGGDDAAAHGPPTEVPGASGCVVEAPDDVSPGTCELTLRIESDVSHCPVAPTEDQCTAICGGPMPCYVVTPTASVSCGSSCTAGRIPEGLVSAELPRGGFGAHFATMAYHEAAAASAFAQLADEMRAQGAPRALVRALARAEADEHRHAAAAGAMARRHGAAPPVPTVTHRPVRSLFEIALENAREGCGRELLGAAVGLHVAEHAARAEHRALFATVARDEVRHASVSLRMQQWLRARLTHAERRAVDAAMRAALVATSAADLPRELSAPDDEHLGRMGAAMDDVLAGYFAA